MIIRTDKRANIPPVRGVLQGHQTRMDCTDLWGGFKDWYMSNEKKGEMHLTIPSDDGYKSIMTPIDEITDSMMKLEPEATIESIYRQHPETFLQILKKMGIL